MSCVKCNGVWQCSTGGDPCNMEAEMAPEVGSTEVGSTETRCYYIYVKKDKGKCKMNIKDQSGPNPGDGWEPAGHVCLEFQVLSDVNTGECFVRVTPLP